MRRTKNNNMRQNSDFYQFFEQGSSLHTSTPISKSKVNFWELNPFKSNPTNDKKDDNQEVEPMKCGPSNQYESPASTFSSVPSNINFLGPNYPNSLKVASHHMYSKGIASSSLQRYHNLEDEVINSSALNFDYTNEEVCKYQIETSESENENEPNTPNIVKNSKVRNKRSRSIKKIPKKELKPPKTMNKKEEILSEHINSKCKSVLKDVNSPALLKKESFKINKSKSNTLNASAKKNLVGKQSKIPLQRQKKHLEKISSEERKLTVKNVSISKPKLPCKIPVFKTCVKKNPSSVGSLKKKLIVEGNDKSIQAKNTSRIKKEKEKKLKKGNVQKSGVENKTVNRKNINENKSDKLNESPNHSSSRKLFSDSCEKDLIDSLDMTSGEKEQEKSYVENKTEKERKKSDPNSKIIKGTIIQPSIIKWFGQNNEIGDRPGNNKSGVKESSVNSTSNKETKKDGQKPEQSIRNNNNHLKRTNSEKGSISIKKTEVPKSPTKMKCKRNSKDNKKTLKNNNMLSRDQKTRGSTEIVDTSKGIQNVKTRSPPDVTHKKSKKLKIDISSNDNCAPISDNKINVAGSNNTSLRGRKPKENISYNEKEIIQLLKRKNTEHTSALSLSISHLEKALVEEKIDKENGELDDVSIKKPVLNPCVEESENLITKKASRKRKASNSLPCSEPDISSTLLIDGKEKRLDVKEKVCANNINCLRKKKMKSFTTNNKDQVLVRTNDKLNESVAEVVSSSTDSLSNQHTEKNVESTGVADNVEELCVQKTSSPASEISTSNGRRVSSRILAKNDSQNKSESLSIIKINKRKHHINSLTDDGSENILPTANIESEQKMILNLENSENGAKIQQRKQFTKTSKLCNKSTDGKSKRKGRNSRPGKNNSSKTIETVKKDGLKISKCFSGLQTELSSQIDVDKKNITDCDTNTSVMYSLKHESCIEKNKSLRNDQYFKNSKKKWSLPNLSVIMELKTDEETEKTPVISSTQSDIVGASVQKLEDHANIRSTSLKETNAVGKVLNLRKRQRTNSLQMTSKRRKTIMKGKPNSIIPDDKTKIDNKEDIGKESQSPHKHKETESEKCSHFQSMECKKQNTSESSENIRANKVTIEETGQITEKLPVVEQNKEEVISEKELGPSSSGVVSKNNKNGTSSSQTLQHEVLLKRFTHLEFHKNTTGYLSAVAWSNSTFKSGILKIDAYKVVEGRSSQGSFFVALVLQGNLKAIVLDAEMALKKWEQFMVPPNTNWKIENTSASTCVISYTSIRMK